MGPRRRTIGRRGVRNGDRRAADGVAESVFEDSVKARRDQAIGRQWVGEFDVFLRGGVMAAERLGE